MRSRKKLVDVCSKEDRLDRAMESGDGREPNRTGERARGLPERESFSGWADDHDGYSRSAIMGMISHEKGISEVFGDLYSVERVEVSIERERQDQSAR